MQSSCTCVLELTASVCLPDHRQVCLSAFCNWLVDKLNAELEDAVIYLFKKKTKKTPGDASVCVLGLQFCGCLELAAAALHQLMLKELPLLCA